MTTPLLFGVAVVPAIIGLIEVCKDLGLPSRAAPAAAVVLGVLASLAGTYAGVLPWIPAAVTGIAMGLSAAGLYAGAKTMIVSSPIPGCIPSCIAGRRPSPGRRASRPQTTNTQTSIRGRGRAPVPARLHNPHERTDGHRMKASMIRPVDSVPGWTITQEFANKHPIEPLGCLLPDGRISYYRSDPGTWDHLHNGVDYGVPLGSQLLAACAGTVYLADLSPSGFGLRLMVDFGPGWFLYGHLSSIGVSPGDRVSAGQIVALSGGANGDERDGNSTGAHLHFSVIGKGGRYYPPARFVVR